MIKLHSTVAEITNSSSVTYTWVTGGGVDALKSMINSVLEEAGSDKTADDLFEVKLVFGDYAKEILLEQWLDRQENEEIDYWGADAEGRKEIEKRAMKELSGGLTESEFAGQMGPYLLP